MAKGAVSKEQLFKKLQECFPDSFWEDPGKILRVPFSEDGERVEIKVSLTAAKVNLGVGGTSAFEDSPVGIKGSNDSNVESMTEVTQEEKDNVAALLKALNL